MMTYDDAMYAATYARRTLNYLIRYLPLLVVVAFRVQSWFVNTSRLHPIGHSLIIWKALTWEDMWSPLVRRCILYIFAARSLVLLVLVMFKSNHAFVRHPGAVLGWRLQNNHRHSIISYSSAVDHRPKQQSQSVSSEGSFASASARGDANGFTTSQLSLDKAEYLVVLWHSLSEFGLELDHPHNFDSTVSAGLMEHVQYCVDVDLIRNYEVYDTSSSLLMEPRTATVVDNPDNEPLDMDNILEVTRDWVKAMIADFSICPYTIDADRAGKPIGGVRYSISDASSPEEAFRDFWAEVYGMLSTTEEDISTVLLTYPRRVFKDDGYFEKVPRLFFREI